MNRMRLPVVATGRYAKSPTLRNRPICTAARNEIGTVTKLWSTEAGTKPMIARTTDWTPMVQRNEWGSTCSMRPDLMWDASNMPAMNANRGHRCASAAENYLSDTWIAEKMTLAVCTLANTWPRAI